jgi:hypothetical protein
MGTAYWFRAGIMAMALVAVLFVMRRLNQTPGTMGLHYFGGASRGAKTVAINLCPTRVVRVEFGQQVIFEDKMKWYRAPLSDPSARELLDPVAVEKWFSRNCTFVADKADPSADVHTAMKVSFVSGEPQILLQSAGGDYEWMGHPFHADAMDRGLKDLAELPASNPPPGP